MRYRLRTLLIVLALGPAILAWPYRAWRASVEKAERERHKAEMKRLLQDYVDGGWGGRGWVELMDP